MYATTWDPWNFETSPYERRKYEATMAALPKARYLNGFEPGCSIGVLSEMLASRCRRLLATDLIPEALDQAAARLKQYRNVRVKEASIPDGWPAEAFDLIVLSEIAYYFDESDLRTIMDLTVGSTLVGAHVVGVHWRGEANYPLSGDRAHELMDSTARLRRIVHLGDEEFVLDVWERTR